MIEYPDTVDGEISITGTTAPVRLVANSSGRIILLIDNLQSVKQGDIIANIATGANYKHILKVDSLIQNMPSNIISGYPLPDSLILGDIGAAYSSFYLSYMQYTRAINSDVYQAMRRNMEQKITSDAAVAQNMARNISMKEIIVKDAQERYESDSILYSVNGISQKEFLDRRASRLTNEESLLALRSSHLAKLSEISQGKIDVQRISLEESENKEKLMSEVIAQRNSLMSAIALWKEHYLIQSPIAGEVEYLGFWKDNATVQAGQELFSIIPRRDDVIGEVMIPSFGAGKVKPGQIANVKINNFPYEEYGMIKGKVKSLSRMTNKLESANGTVEAYLVEVSFPDGVTTNFGKTLPLDFETKGSVEIITEPKRLIERLFDNLKSKGVK